MVDGRRTLDAVACHAEPAAQRLVLLLAPWERARLRLTCKALAGTVPAEACFPTLAAMARAGTRVALLRYDMPAPSFTPLTKAHARIAVANDNDDALAWMEACGAFAWGTDPAHGGWLLDEALAAGGVRAVRFALDRSGRRPDVVMLRCCKGRWTAELAALLVGPVVAALPPERLSYFEQGGSKAYEIYDMLSGTTMLRENAVVWGALLDAWPRRPLPAVVAEVALLEGLRERVEPVDWEAICGLALISHAVKAGALDLAERGLAVFPPADNTYERQLLYMAVYSCSYAPSVIEWLLYRLPNLVLTLVLESRALVNAAIDADADDVLRWLADNKLLDAGTPALVLPCVQRAIGADSPRAVSFLVDALRASPAETLVDALCRGSFATAEAMARRASAPLGAAEFGKVAHRCPRRALAMLLLRRHGLLPPPSRELLESCLADPVPVGLLTALVEAGYCLGGDLAGWVESLPAPADRAEEHGWTDLARAVFERCREALCYSQ